MERIKVSVPASFPFSTTIPIRITDLNYGGHVGNHVFLSLIHEARLQFLASKGYSEFNFAGTGLIMADAAIESKREMLYGDQVKISVAATGFDKIGFDIIYLMETKEGETWVTAGKAKTGMVCFDYATKKKTAIPPEAVHTLTSQLNYHT